MKHKQQQLILGKTDHGIIMRFLNSGQARTLFNRHDAEELLLEIKKAKVVEDNKLPTDVVRLNSAVQVRDEDQQKLIDLVLVTPSMANIKEKKISIMSPIGIALLGCRKGQRVVWKVPVGEKQFMVTDVSYDAKQVSNLQGAI